ncbi:MAG: succinate dehydrogenase, hydrophobic membrane anchor protein [Alphaproteobacteria bacterium 41-28]|nr:MAG: succinate dehydrogenase, hydrophobic membrane anchor protein [Alphaproteobacteria bacterium 41-28]
MKFESNLRRAQGLGSAKSGLHHWVAQRITAVALIPLGIWFVGAFIVLSTSPFEVAYSWLSSLWTATLAIFFVLVLFYHGYLGIQVILEDYIPHEFTKWAFIITIKLFSVLMALLAIVSILKIFLS